MIVLLIMLVLVPVLFFIFIELPQKDNINKIVPESFMIFENNYFEVQEKLECSGFSSAYVLRHFKKKASGMDTYKKIEFKMPGGITLPRGIIKLFKQQNLPVIYYKGTLEQLEARLNKGIPIIALIKVFKDKSYLHYTTIVGYDENNLYIAESLKFLINSEDTKNYNRIINKKDFFKLWDVGIPFHSYSYFIID